MIKKIDARGIFMIYRNALTLTTALFTLAISLASAQSTLHEFPQTITPPLGLQPVPWPKDNPYTPEKAELGRLLYFDKRLSSNETVSCATCHNIRCGYGDCKAIAIGIDNSKGTRHSPSIINGAYSPLLFWDGRASSLEEQCEGPIANIKEMSTVENVHEAHEQCSLRVQKIPGYKKLFSNVFGTDTITMNEISKAISTFERTILSGNSAYDQYNAGNKSALTEEQIKGIKVFKKANCINCHTDFNFTDNRFHNIGIGMDVENPDLGRFMITKNKNDFGAFKTPGLRDVARTGPYMHDGRFNTLEEVIEYYDQGGIPNKNLHRLMKPLGLTPEEKKALVNFLKALNGEGWQQFHEPTIFPK